MMMRWRRCTTCIWLIWLAAAAPAGSAAIDTASSTAAVEDREPQATAQTRFFIDEGYFLEGDTEVLRAYIAASNGRMTISGESSAAFLSVKGYYVPDSWDVYWTVRQACHMAFKHMQPNQKVNCLPGVSAMSLKRNFVETWQKAYGESAFNFIPRSYLIPEQYWLWRSHLLATHSPPDRKWVLKANIHRGKGVSVVPQHTAISHALTHSHEPTLHSSSQGSATDDGIHYLNVLVQSYLQDQMTLAGRSSYIRVWLLVTSIDPLRAYLFNGGLAIFGKQKGNNTAAAAAGNKQAGSGVGSTSSSPSSSSNGDDLIVNLWIQDRGSSPIWSLQQLQAYLDAHPEVVVPLSEHQKQQQQQQHIQQQGRKLQQHHLPVSSNSSNSSHSQSHKEQQQQQQQQPQRRTFADAWRDMQTSASLVLAAALPAMRAAAAESGAPKQGMFEYFGLDFVLDEHLQPWMLEVNAIPSMARRKKSDCAGESATASCKLSITGASANSSGGSNTGSKGSGDSSSGSNRAGDDFDEQKELFVHDMLVLLGLPVNKPSKSAPAAAAAQPTAKDSSHSSGAGSTSDAAALLHRAAAAAAGAGIRSAKALSKPTAGSVHGSNNTSSQGSSSSSTGSNSGGRARQLLQHSSSPRFLPSSPRRILPLTEQQKQQQHEQQQWLRLQRRRHWRQVVESEEEGVSVTHEDVHGSTTVKSTSSSSNNSQQVQQTGKATSLTDVVGLHWSAPAPTLAHLPEQLRSLLCAPSDSSSSNEFACITCLTADDLAALAAVEEELLRAGRFVPVHDLLAAHAANRAALMARAAIKAAAAHGTTAVPISSATGAVDTATGAPGTPSTPTAGVPSGAAYLSEERSVWQMLYAAWQALSKGGVGVRDLGIMKYYTDASEVKASMQLNLHRQDYVMSAWLRVRQEVTCVGLSNPDCVVQRLRKLSSQCYLE